MSGSPVAQLTLTGPMWAPEGDVTILASADSNTYVYSWHVCVVYGTGEDPDVVCNPPNEYGYLGDEVGSESSWTMWFRADYYQVRFKVQLRAWDGATAGALYDEKVWVVEGPASPGVCCSGAYGSPPAHGLYLPTHKGWDDCRLTTAGDWDGDGIDQACEYEVAWSFRPRLLFSSDEPGAGREPYWSVKEGPDPRTFQIFYALSYYTDWGFKNPVVPGAHNGDSEFIILTVGLAPGTTNKWQLKSAFLSAHWEPDNYRDSHWYNADKLKYRDGEYLTRPQIYVAWGKHANYRSWVRCEFGASGLDSCLTAKDTGAEVEVLSNANLGNRYSKPGAVTWLNTCVFSRADPYRTGTECYWDPLMRFAGWIGDAVNTATEYQVPLKHFSF